MSIRHYNLVILFAGLVRRSSTFLVNKYIYIYIYKIGYNKIQKQNKNHNMYETDTEEEQRNAINTEFKNRQIARGKKQKPDEDPLNWQSRDGYRHQYNGDWWRYPKTLTKSDFETDSNVEVIDIEWDRKKSIADARDYASTLSDNSEISIDLIGDRKRPLPHTTDLPEGSPPKRQKSVFAKSRESVSERKEKNDMLLFEIAISIAIKNLNAEFPNLTKKQKNKVLSKVKF